MARAIGASRCPVPRLRIQSDALEISRHNAVAGFIPTAPGIAVMNSEFPVIHPRITVLATSVTPRHAIPDTAERSADRKGRAEGSIIGPTRYRSAAQRADGFRITAWRLVPEGHGSYRRFQPGPFDGPSRT